MCPQFIPVASGVACSSPNSACSSRPFVGRRTPRSACQKVDQSGLESLSHRRGTGSSNPSPSRRESCANSVIKCVTSALAQATRGGLVWPDDRRFPDGSCSTWKLGIEISHEQKSRLGDRFSRHGGSSISLDGRIIGLTATIGIPLLSRLFGQWWLRRLSRTLKWSRGEAPDVCYRS